MRGTFALVLVGAAASSGCARQSYYADGGDAAGDPGSVSLVPVSAIFPEPIVSLGPVSGLGAQNVAAADFAAPGGGPPDGVLDLLFNYWALAGADAARVVVRSGLGLAAGDFEAVRTFGSMVAGQGISVGASGPGAAPPEWLVFATDAAPDQVYWYDGADYVDLAADNRYPSDNALLAGADTGSTFTGALIDYDGDGDLDLYRVVGDTTSDNVLLTNRGLGVSGVPELEVAPVDAPGDDAVWVGESARAAAVYDFDLDGGPDIFSASYSGTLFLNRTTVRDRPRFVPYLPAGSFNPVVENQQGAAALDYDADGDLDLFVPNWGGAPCRLWENLTRPGGSFGFVEVGDAAVVLRPGNNTGAYPADYDNDGDFDLFVTRDGSANALLRNDLIQPDGSPGTGFTEVTAEAGDLADLSLASYTGVWIDLDGDGDLDLVIGVSAGAGHLMVNRYYEAGGTARAYRVRVRVGGRANVPGTRVEVVLGTRRLVQQISASTGFGSTTGPDLFFGAGDRATVDEVSIYPPGTALAASVRTAVPTAGAGGTVEIVDVAP